MARGEMLTVFSYDISRDRIRRKAARLLAEAASRVQLSVFETRLPRHRCEALAQRVAALLEPGDSLRVYVIGADGEARSRVYGDALPFEPEAAYWIA